MDFGSNSDFSVSCWVQEPESPFGNITTAIGNINDGSCGWLLFSSSGYGIFGESANYWTTLTCGLNPDSGTNFTFSQTVESTGWIHFVVVFARSAGCVWYYVNGSLAGENLIPPNTGDFGTGPLRIFGNNNGGAIYPQIGEVCVWNRALSGPEIAGIYNAGLNAGENVVAYSAGTTPNPNPTEPLNMVHSTLQDLELLEAWHSAPMPIPVVASTYDNANKLQLTIYGMPWLNYTLLSTTNLATSSWQVYTTNVLESSTNMAWNPSARSSFYRASYP
jgi:hypothetical protein